jgi:carboxymethylenebutenolidase
MDGIGIRPAMFEVGERIAAHGYFALLPDLFYRAGPYEPMNARTVFADPEQRKILTEKFRGPAAPQNLIADTAAFIAYLQSQKDAPTTAPASRTTRRPARTCSRRR